MYTILFNQDKELIQTVRVPLFQGERNIEWLQFLIPATINEIDVSQFKVLLRYELPNGKKFAVNLIRETDMYRDYYCYKYPVSYEFTESQGYIYYYIVISDTSGNMAYKSNIDTIEIRERAKESLVGGEIIWEADKSLFPYPGSSSTLYVDLSADKIYRWDETKKSYEVVGSDYMDITAIEDGDLND